MEPGILNLRSGRIVHWDLTAIDPNKSLAEQARHLKEDLGQIEFADGTIIDMGWYPEFNVEGAFTVQLVRGSNWEAPLMQKRCRKIEDLIAAANEMIEFAARGTRG